MKDQNPLQLTVWMNYPSFHQGDMFRVLTTSSQVDLEVVYAKSLTPDRLQLGWHDDLKGYPHRFINKRAPQLDAIRMAWAQRQRIHIINGIWAEPSFAAALVTLALAGSKYVLYSEAPDPTIARSAAKRMLQGRVGRALAAKAMGALPVSSLGFDFFRRLGVSEPVIFPFGYFQTHNVQTESPARLTAVERTEVIFVGQLIPRKGVDLLLEAMQPLFDDYTDLRLAVIGAGSEAQALQDGARALRMPDRVNFEGTVSSDLVQSRIALADVLVLPSRWDGWGMVVNEALSAGVPVIVSDRCGAADLIQHGVNGYVFRSEDVDGLRQCLRKFLDNVDQRSAMRSAAASTGRAVSAEAAGPYLIDCLKHMTGESDARPAPPWLPVPVSQSASH